MMKAIQQAMELSKAFEGNNKEADDKDSNTNMDSMMKMVQMFKLMNTVSPKQKHKNEEERDNKEFLYEDFNKHVTYFEDDINIPAINTIKSALPYLDYKYQKNIGIAVKFIEIQRILDKYSSATINMDLTKSKYWRRDMILAIRPHMDEDKKKMIDTIVKFMDIKEIIEKDTNQVEGKEVKVDFDRVLEDDAFKNIEPKRIEAIKNLAKESEGKSMQEVMMLIMKYNKALNTGRNLNKDEVDAMLNALFKGIDENDRDKFRNIIKLIEMMG